MRNDDAVFKISKPALHRLVRLANASGTNAQNLFRRLAYKLASDPKPQFSPSGAPLDQTFIVGLPNAINSKLVTLCGKLEMPRDVLAELVISYLTESR